jgi:uncharacterized membrane protein
MDTIFNLLIIGLIIVLWFLSNAFNKPVLNNMMNYYEDDTEGRQAANIFIAFMLVLSFILGSRMY